MTWLEWLIPPANREDADSVADARRLIGVFLGFMCGGAVAGFAVSVLTVYTGVGVVVAVGECLCALVLMFFRATGATRLTLFFLSIVVSSTLVTTSWVAHGAFGPMAWLVILPFLGAMVLRSQNVAINSSVAIVAVVADLALRLEGMDPRTLGAEDAVNSISVAFAICVAGGLGILTSRSYQTTLADLRRLNADHVVLQKKNERERWFKDGQMGLLEHLRGEQNLPTLCNNALNFLATYLEAQAGALFSADPTGTLSLAAGYAYSEGRHSCDTFKPGQGLVGQAGWEKRSRLLVDVPEGYLKIQSGLGETSPRTILVTPILVEDTLLGVVELASLGSLADSSVEFLESISENLAIAMRACQDRTRVRELLEETQRQSRRLQEQQAQLQKANYELEEQTSDLRESEERLQRQSEELRASNEELKEKTEHLERQKADVAEKNAKLEVANEDIETKARELGLANKYKSEFLANMSHELRTPLNSLLILADNLSQNHEGNLTEDQVKSAEIIHGGGRSLLSLINDILDLSKVEAGMLEVDVQRAEIDSVIFALQEGFRPVADERGVELVVETEPDVPAVIQTDSQRAQQILKNFLSNAFKFTEQGSVTLRVFVPRGDVRFTNVDLSCETTVGFSVIDTGIGIPADRQAAVFEAFRQADGGTSRKYGGTGLGLSISQEITRLLGGEIQVESRPGEGSVFTLYLPRECPQASARQSTGVRTKALPVSIPEPPSRSGYHGGRQRETVIAQQFVADDRGRIGKGEKSILIVEEDAEFAEILVNLSRKRGYKCITTPKGASALQLCSELKPTAVLLDLGLPDIDGKRVLGHFKHNLDTRYIPVHVISDREDARYALQRGAVGCLEKPASAESVAAAFSKLEDVVDQDVSELLVVESHDGEQRAIAELLKYPKAKVTTAESGAQAIEAYTGTRYHCIVVGDQLSDMTVLELVEKMSSNGYELPPTIVYSRNGDDAQQFGLHRQSDTAIVKCVRSLDRVLDEVTLFLHSAESSLSAEQQQTLRMLHDPEKVLQGRTVMLVDDDMRNAFALAKILRERGLKVVMADNGQVALERLEQEDGVDLVIMDIMMPVMDGYEAMRKIRKDGRFSSLPIIALTAHAMAEDREKCLRAGANGYMSKPVDVENLASLLRVWLFEAA